MHPDYARAYMTERLQEAEERRLVASSRRQPSAPSLLTRLTERRFGRWSESIGPAPAILGTSVVIEADCCGA